MIGVENIKTNKITTTKNTSFIKKNVVNLIKMNHLLYPSKSSSPSLLLVQRTLGMISSPKDLRNNIIEDGGKRERVGGNCLSFTSSRYTIYMIIKSEMFCPGFLHPFPISEMLCRRTPFPILESHVTFRNAPQSSLSA